MTGGAHIRGLERRDLSELVQLCREHAEFERARWSEHEREAGLATLFLDSDDARCLVVEAPAELAGFASAGLEVSTWEAQRYLHRDCLFLRPAYRAMGLGRKLVGCMARAAMEFGAANLQWQTPAWNEGAVRFYNRLGAEGTEKLRFTLSREECARLVAAGAGTSP